MIRILITLFSCILLITGCSGPKRQSGGGYYKDDGPGRSAPANIQAIPDAVPRIETHAPANRRPYVVFGKRYVPISDERAFRQTGIASWYGRKFHGNKTANGETYDMYAMTAAHPTLPLPSYARVTHARSGKSIIVRINDRGPFHSARIIDLSYVAAAKLDLIGPGSGPVIVEAITNTDIRNNAYQRSNQPAPKAMPIPDAAPPSGPPVLTVHANTDQTTGTVNRVPQGTALAGSAADPPGSRPDALAALNLNQGAPEPQSPVSGTTPPEPSATPGLHTVAYSPSKQAASRPPAGTPPASNGTTSGSASALIFLQYGAFSTPENAHRLATSLNQEIAHIENRQAEISSSANIHRVHIGPYSSRAQAVNAALRIQAETGREATYRLQDVNDDAGQDHTALSL